MNGDFFGTGVLLLAVGMITVFVILLLIVLTGNLLIATTNKYFSESKVTSTNGHPTTKALVSQKYIAIITATVKKVTEGQGNVKKVERISE